MSLAERSSNRRNRKDYVMDSLNAIDLTIINTFTTPVANVSSLRLGASIAGTATLVLGTTTVLTNSVTATSKIFLSRRTPLGTPLGELSFGTIVAGTSFVITSVIPTTLATQTNDVSSVDWLIIN
jgi:hypothetical protein